MRRLIHGGWIELGLEAGFFQVLLRERIRIVALSRLHRVFLLLCSGGAPLVGMINLLLNDLPAARGLLGVFCEGVKFSWLAHGGSWWFCDLISGCLVVFGTSRTRARAVIGRVMI